MTLPRSLDFSSLAAAYAQGLSPAELVREVARRCEASPDPAIWIHRIPLAALLERARAVEAKGRASQPLYGIPFAIKDNIDLEGAPTTAGCPDFSYAPPRSAPVVARLIEAGAIALGKTNLDQFATGLVGTRSPYGAPRSPFNPDFVSGGSSSGSAVAVATGLAAFALGTDTAGSGRVPASFNNLAGLKPTRGWLSTRGVVPACRSLDCVSILALTVEDARAAAGIAAGFDPEDPYSRVASPFWTSATPASFRFGVPPPEQLEWFGDRQSPAVFDAALARLESLGGRPVPVDLEPFREAARLLYEGPWVAERWVAIQGFLSAHASAVDPVVRGIIEGAARFSAADLFSAEHRLEALRRTAGAVWGAIDALVLPTAPTLYRVDEVAADPVRLNSRLGHYTNFANLLDFAALAVPAAFRPDGLPFGITLFGPAWSDGWLADLGAAFQRASALPLGATGQPLPPASAVSPVPPAGIPIAVVGAHLSGQPLNKELTTRGGRLVRSARTADCYRLFALAGTVPLKPGLARVGPGEGAGIELEIWTLPPAAWADFVAAIPQPLGIGSLQLEDGSRVKGFICEAAGFAGAEDVTRFGGWRAYLASRSQPASAR